MKTIRLWYPQSNSINLRVAPFVVGMILLDLEPRIIDMKKETSKQRKERYRKEIDQCYRDILKEIVGILKLELEKNKEDKKP